MDCSCLKKDINQYGIISLYFETVNLLSILLGAIIAAVLIYLLQYCRNTSKKLKLLGRSCRPHQHCVVSGKGLKGHHHMKYIFKRPTPVLVSLEVKCVYVKNSSKIIHWPHS